MTYEENDHGITLIPPLIRILFYTGIPCPCVPLGRTLPRNSSPTIPSSPSPPNYEWTHGHRRDHGKN